MPPASRLVGAVAVLVAALALGAPAALAAVDVEHVSVSAVAPDGIVGPGDTVAITETIRNRSIAPLSALTATLGSPVATVPMTSTSSYAPLAPAAEIANAPAFQAEIPSTVRCGAGVPFEMTVSGIDGASLVPFEIPTGVAGARRSYESTRVPRPIPAGSVGTLSVPGGGVQAAAVGDATSSVTVADAGLVKNVRVRIGKLTYPDVGHLRLTLLAPDGVTSVVLFDGEATGADFTDTVFVVPAAGVPGIGGSGTPHTGTYTATQSLGAFAAADGEGTWQLDVTTSTPAQTGELVAWGLDVDPAVCDLRPAAAVVATPNPAVPGQDVVVSAARSVSPVGDALTYEWSVDGAPFAAGAATRPAQSYPVGPHTFTVRVTDAHGRSTEASTTVKVTEAPTTNLTASPADPQSGQTITLDSGSADTGGSVVLHEWDLDGNGTFERSTDGVRTLQTKFTTPGAHPVSVRVTDNDGATSAQTLVITVRTLPPVASFTVSPAPPVIGSPATLSAIASLDLDGRIARYEWDLDGDGTYETDGAAAATVQHVFTAAGPIAVRLRVTDDSGAQAEKTVSVSPNRAPVAAVTAAPNPVLAGHAVTFDAGGSLDPDGTLARFQWDLDGDGIFELDTATTATAARAYPNAGGVTVRVRVTDDAGTPAVGSVDVVVRPVADPTGGSGGSTAPADGGGAAPAPAAPVPRGATTTPAADAGAAAAAAAASIPAGP
ncbi:MAG: hypothetical protein QOF04_1546, partial [Solirubrobacteraceae bacterium]|nr:hypothetical protein [Solirubrobacteraceae bacterium]